MFRWKLTDEGMTRITAQPQNAADSLGISLLDQQLNDCLAIGIDQILALSRKGVRQEAAHFLHSLHHFFLKEHNKAQNRKLPFRGKQINPEKQ